MTWRDRFTTLEIYPPRVEWAQIGADLKQAGVPYSGQAEAIGKKWSTMERWLQGSEPRWSNAIAWLALHSRVCGTALTELRIQEAAQRGVGDLNAKAVAITAATA